MADNRRDKGMGSIRQKPNGTWEGRYKGASCSAKTEGEIKKKLKALVKKIDSEQELGIKSKDMPFSEWLDTWISEYKKNTLKPTTYTSYVQNIDKHIKPGLGNLDLSKITADDIQSLFSKMIKAGLKPASVVKVKNIINNALEQAVKSRYILFNPAQATIPPKANNTEVRVFTPNEQTKFLAVLQGHRLAAFYYAALGTGLRRGELLALTWECIDFQKGEITVKGSVARANDDDAETKTALILSTPKTRSSRRKVPMIGNIKAVLLEHQKRQENEKEKAGSAWNPSNLVFCSTVGTYLEPRRVSTNLAKFLEMAELEHINFHALRHTFATRFLEYGGSLKALQEILGHTDASLTLNTYAHIVGSTAHNEIQKINSLFDIPKQTEKNKPNHKQLFQPHNKRKKAVEAKER